MFFKILFALAAVLEFVFAPLFLKHFWPKKCVKSISYKMAASTMFIFAGLLAMKISSNSSSYAVLVMWGLVFGWLGDLFLGYPTDKIAVSGLGLFAFLGGHIFYIAAFQKAIYIRYPQAHAIAWYEIILVAALVGLIAFYANKKKINLKTYMAVPVAMYAVTISFMLIKALRLCIGEWAYGMNDHMAALFLTVAVGAVLFVLSDATLGILMFAGQENNRPLKYFNIGTYYAAQLLLASSIFIIYTPVPMAR